MKGVAKGTAGKSAVPGEPDSTARLRPGGQLRKADSREKPLGDRRAEPVPETDTGGRGEDPKVLERFMAKELGKMTL